MLKMTFLGWVQVLQLKPQVLILVSGVRPGVRGGRRVECRNRERISRRPPPTEAVVASEMLFRLMLEWQKKNSRLSLEKSFASTLVLLLIIVHRLHLSHLNGYNLILHLTNVKLPNCHVNNKD